MVDSAGGGGAGGGGGGQPWPLSHSRKNVEQVMPGDSQGWFIERILLSLVSVSLFHFG